MNLENNILTNILVGIIVFSVVLNILFVFKILNLKNDFESNKQITAEKTEIKTELLNQNIVNFLKLFIQDVLKSDKKIDELSKTKLDNAVNLLDDEKISELWRIFSESKTEKEAQKNVKDLLEDLINKLEQ